MRLRRRLIATMAVLLVVGLLVADIVTYTSLRSFLYGRLDEQLDAAQDQAYGYITTHDYFHQRSTPLGLGSHVSPDVYVMVLNSFGKVILSRPSGPPGQADPQPIIPSTIAVTPRPRSTRFGVHHGTFRPEPGTQTVNAKGDAGVRYRTEAVSVPEGTLVVAVSINPTSATLDSLLKIELGASAAVVLILCIVGALTIRRGLRPLEDMTQTARAIASGDLTRRVPASDEVTEVGRLGASLNVMLSQIEEAFKEKSWSEARLRQFVADASHELRTPLTSIRGYTELLQRGAIQDDEGRRKALARVLDEATRMGGLVDDLLLLARLDQGRPLEMTAVDLRAAFANAIADAEALDPDRLMELEATEAVIVAGDRDRLNQVAHNLVRNCLEHTPQGTPITVRVLRRAPFGVAQVIDQGAGMSPDEMTRVFDRFYRGDAARSTSGTGLGLSIVDAIAGALGGVARVESTPEHGSTFTVEIPLASAELGNGHRTPASTFEVQSTRN